MKLGKICLVLIICFAFLLFIAGIDSDNESTDSSLTLRPTDATEEPTEEIIDNIEPFELSNGNYLSGVDFVPGTYTITVVKGNGNISTSNMFSGGVNAMMGTDKDYYEQEYKNIKLPAETEVKISNGVTLLFTPVN